MKNGTSSQLPCHTTCSGKSSLENPDKVLTLPDSVPTTRTVHSTGLENSHANPTTSPTEKSGVWVVRLSESSTSNWPNSSSRDGPSESGLSHPIAKRHIKTEAHHILVFLIVLQISR